MRLEGKTALITGAAGGSQDDLIGFGGAAAWLFAREGANVVLTDIDDDLGEATAFQLRKSGGKAIFEEHFSPFPFASLSFTCTPVL